jgi:hypothetical protein
LSPLVPTCFLRADPSVVRDMASQSVSQDVTSRHKPANTDDEPPG